jgi:hypothetical protein
LDNVKPGAAIVKGKVVVTAFVPEMPVSVTVEFATFAVAPAVIVMTLNPVVGFGEKDAVTPTGSPEAARLTLPVNPYSGVTETFVETEDPGPRLAVPGPANVNAGETIPRVSVVSAFRVPLTPVMVRTDVPTDAALVAFNVSVAVPVTGLGEKDAVTPLGSPETAR